MRQTLKQISLLCLFWMIGLSVWAYDFAAYNADGVAIYYCITSSTSPKTVKVTRKDNTAYTAKAINIPSTVTYNGNTYEVTGIDEKAFYDAKDVKSISLPQYLTSIGAYAFYECTGLTSITIPNSVKSIGEWAFSVCYGLTSITIPNSVASIADYTFCNCRGLTSVTIPNSVTSIGVDAFYDCGLISVTIPNSVTSIGNRAFSWCSGLASITVEDGNTCYDSREGCNAIIEKSTNELVVGCKNTIIPNSVMSIGNSAFYHCPNLTSVTIPNSVMNIADYAFFECSGLTSITIPNSVTNIGKSTFYYCSGLTSVTIPNSVTSIGSSAFYYCSGLTSITVEYGNSYYDSRQGCNAIIEKSTNTLIVGCKNTIIPNSVTSIGDQAFYYCTGLTSITIPNSVTSIGNYAFEYCKNATIVLTSKNKPTVGKDVFNKVKAIYYPRCYGWSTEAPYMPYTTLITDANGNYIFEDLDDWGELEIKENCKEYKVIADVSAFLLSASYTRTFTNHEWQAWYIPADVPFSSLSANFEVAKFSDTQASADEIEIESVTSGTLTANTPYLVRLKDDKATGEYSIVADESTGLKETVENEVNIGSNYKLKTTYRELSGAELKGKYALSEGKFKKAGDSATLKPFRVYLEPVTTGAADVLDLVMDGATDITLTPSSGKGAETIYNLNGQAVGNDYKGIVIKNGKKVLKK